MSIKKFIKKILRKLVCFGCFEKKKIYKILPETSKNFSKLYCLIDMHVKYFNDFLLQH